MPSKTLHLLPTLAPLSAAHGTSAVKDDKGATASLQALWSTDAAADAAMSPTRTHSLMAQAMHELIDGLSVLQQATAAGDVDAETSALQQLAARWLTALAAVGAPRGLLRSVQKNLMLMARMPERPPIDGAQHAIADLDDAQLAHTLLGMLRVAEEREELRPVDAVDVDTVEDMSQPLAKALQRTSRGLVALDDLGEALSLRPDQAASLWFAHGLLLWVEAETNATFSLSTWLQRRGAHPGLVRSAAFADQLPALPDNVADALTSIGEARAVALWTLTAHLADRLELAAEAPPFAALVAKARLSPAEVADVLDLWSTLDADGKL